MTARLRTLLILLLSGATLWLRAASAQDVPSAPPVSNPAAAQPDTADKPVTGTATPDEAEPSTVVPAPIVRVTPGAAQPDSPPSSSAPAEPPTGTSHPDTALPAPTEPTLLPRNETAQPAPDTTQPAATTPAAAPEPSQPAAAIPAPAPQPVTVPEPAPAAVPEPAETPAPRPAALPQPVTIDQPAPAPSAEGAPPNTARGVLLDRAWTMLTENAAAGKNPNDRIQALAALGTMGSDDHAARLISDAFTSKDVDVRLAAILAAGQTKNPRLVARMREAFDDPDPQVAYTAAITLWKNHDKSGEDLLIAVAEGDKRASESMSAGLKRKGQQEIHNPKLMATQGLEAGAGFAFGPAGFGVKAIMFAKGQGGGVARAVAVDMLAESHTEQVHHTLVDCLSDKETPVRAACAKGLGNWPGAETAGELAPLLDDNKLPVRLTAAASYIRASRPPLGVFTRLQNATA